MHLFHLKTVRQIYRGNLVSVCTTTTNIPTVKNNMHIIIDAIGIFIIALTIYTISRPKSPTRKKVGTSYFLWLAPLSHFSLSTVKNHFDIYFCLYLQIPCFLAKQPKNAKLEPNSIPTAASSQSSRIFRRFRWYNGRSSATQLLFSVTNTTIFIGNWTNDF